MSIKAEIIADSINPKNCRLTTFILEYPRFFHSEVMTHRMFSKNAASCLSGDTVITIEKPSILKLGKKMKHTQMTISDIVNKWFNGDSTGRDMKNRLSSMNLRCLNEDTGEFITTKIKNCIKSGIKDLYEITLYNGYKLKCTKEHRIFGSNGWFTLNDLNIRNESFGVSWNYNSPEIATNGQFIDLDVLISQKEEGKSLTEICKLNDWDFKSASTLCEKNKIRFRKKILLNEDLSYKDYYWLKNKIEEGLYSTQIAKLCNTTVDRVKKSVRKFKLKGNKWTWGSKPVWNKGKRYSLPDSSLIKVRENAAKMRKNNSYKKYKDFNIAITRFLTEIRLEIMNKFNWSCQITGSNKNLELHHIDPVFNNKEKAFDVNNIIPLNKKVHRFIHANNLELEFLDWYVSGKNLKDFIVKYEGIKKIASEINKPVSKGNFLCVRYSKIKDIKYLGKEETYDLEVDGPYHNFIANGIVVHNSRAIPFDKFVEQITNNPATPEFWGKNQSGMQAVEELDDIQKTEYIIPNKLYVDANNGGLTTAKKACINTWLEARDSAIGFAKQMNKLGAHKQIVNRILEPWFHIRVIFSGTDFDNFFALRAHKDAQPEFKILAEKMLEIYNNSEPKSLKEGEWHIPFGDKINEKRIIEYLEKIHGFADSGDIKTIKKKIAIARCARISYQNFEGKDDYEADIKLCDRLFGSVPRHLSPTEHVAQSLDSEEYIGNFRGFKQYRKFFSDENSIDSRVIKKYYKA